MNNSNATAYHNATAKNISYVYKAIGGVALHRSEESVTWIKKTFWDKKGIRPKVETCTVRDGRGI